MVAIKLLLFRWDYTNIKQLPLIYNGDYNRITESDNIGFLAFNKKIKSNNLEYTPVPVVIRSGGYDNEWASNVKIGKSGDHQGFDMAVTKAKQLC